MVRWGIRVWTSDRAEGELEKLLLTGWEPFAGSRALNGYVQLILKKQIAEGETLLPAPSPVPAQLGPRPGARGHGPPPLPEETICHLCNTRIIKGAPILIRDGRPVHTPCVDKGVGAAKGSAPARS